MRQLDVLLADHHPIFAEGLQAVLSHPGRGFQFNIKGIANSGEQVKEMLYHNNPDLLLLDLTLAETEGLKLVPSVKKQHANTRILIMTGEEEPDLVKEMFEFGADGFMLRSGTRDELLLVIEQVLNGDSFWHDRKTNGSENHAESKAEKFAKAHNLTQRELEILQLIAKAMDNRKIGAHLFISHQTVGVHRKNIMRKLAVNSTASLVKLAFENKLV